MLLGLQYAGDSENSLLSKIIYLKPCDTAITYKLGNLDPNFNISTNDAEQDLKEAAAIWETAYGKQLFKQDPRGELVVNFIYDERQQLRTDLDKKEGQLDTAKWSLDIRIANYQSSVADYEKRANQLNSEIQSWNKKGGAPSDVYKRLTSQITSMKAEASALNQEAQKLNKEAEGLGKSVDNLNATVTSYNTLLDTKPEEGLYDSGTKTISIYMLTDHKELISVLAHEFGHALGIGHVPDKKALMYSYANSNLKLTPEDLTELTKVCQKQNRLTKLPVKLL